MTIRRVDVQSPGRDAYQVAIDTKTKVPITDIRLTNGWIKSSLPTVRLPIEATVSQQHYTYAQRYNLTNPLSAGLYRIDITAADQESWSAWVIWRHYSQASGALDIKR